MKAQKRRRFTLRSYRNEIVTLCLVACTLFLAISFITFNPHDQSWAFYTTHGSSTTNKCGIFGAQIAALFFYLFGSASFFIILMLSCTIYAMLFSVLAYEWDRVVAAGILMMVWSCLCSMYSIDFWGSPYEGGMFGALTQPFLCSYFDVLGTQIFLYLLFLVSLIVLMRFSFIHAVSVAVSWCGNFLRRVAKSKRVYQYCGQLSEKCAAFTQGIKTGFRYLGAQLIPIRTDVYDHQEYLLDDTEVFHPIDECAPDVVQSATLSVEAPSARDYVVPPSELFNAVKEEKKEKTYKEEHDERAQLLHEKLERFGIRGEVTAIRRGPVVTLFEYQPEADAKISKIVALEDDLALALRALSIRIIAPIPGRSVIGFELANVHRHAVLIGSIINANSFKNASGKLPLILGEDTQGNPSLLDLASAPHLLVAGSTGSGKSVALNTMLISLLCKRTPQELKLLLIDPKRLEFAAYADIPHLLFPIVADPRQATPLLKWAVHEMEQRYEKMAQKSAKTIDDYNKQVEKDQVLPYIVIIIDELADLMMTAAKEIEGLIARLAQMARAAGIHLIVATQRPSVDVITGLIKVNFPCRISFRVTSKIDSRTILDTAGAEKLLGKGDMLVLSSSDSLIKRIHGAYVTDEEINRIVAHVRNQQQVHYLDIAQELPKAEELHEKDPMFDQVLHYVQTVEDVSISLLQRKFRIGYNRSARIIEMLEIQGFIMPSQGSKTRKVIKKI